jgi:CheY-like chemotaxis protein
VCFSSKRGVTEPAPQREERWFSSRASAPRKLTDAHELELSSMTLGSQGVRTVLIVDDNRDAADSLAMLLQFEGCTVNTAADGAEALAAFDRLQPEIVLLDIGLPDIDGYEVARRIRSRQGPKKAMLIALTGWGQDQDKKRAAQAGFDEHLTKPVNLDLLRMLMNVAKPGQIP